MHILDILLQSLDLFSLFPVKRRKPPPTREAKPDGWKPPDRSEVARVIGKPITRGDGEDWPAA